MEIYNHPTRHYLQPVNGFSAMEHLNFTAPMASSAVNCDNGSGTPAGIPAGSVMHINSSGALETGATGTQLAMFLLYNSWDPDAYMGCQTADGNDITAISMNSAGVLNATGQTSGIADSAAISRSASGGLWKSTYATNGTITNTYSQASGNYTVWPATCGMELSTTEFEIGKTAADFAPGTLLRSPGASTPSTPTFTGTETDAAKLVAWNKYYQKKRGGFVTPVLASTASGYSATDDGNPNVCGVVSRGYRLNEHNVPVVYFHACYRPAVG